MAGKCDPGYTVKPDGVNELDPCIYEEIERHEGVTVVVLKCKNCGHIEIEWFKEDNDEREGYPGDH